MEARVSELLSKHCKYLRNDHRAKMENAIIEAYQAGQDCMRPPIEMRWRNIRDEQPPVGVKVVGRKRGKWTNLVMRVQTIDWKGRPMDVYHSGNSIHNWMPDEWFPLPV